MEVAQLKFLLKLLGKPDLRGKIQELKPNDRTLVSEVESICRQLRDRALVDCSEEILRIKLTSNGKAYLKKSNAVAEELKILQASAKGAIAPSKIKFASAKKRQELINNLIQRGLLQAAATKIVQVWLTERGKEYLAQEYQPKGNNPVLSLNLLNNYLHFFRQSLLLPSPQITENGQITQKEKTLIPSDEEIFQNIVDLDRELGTGNYLPIFYLRNKLQPPLSRDELDRVLYRLQRQDKIELSSLVETIHYTKEQIEAGIPQDIGGPLFFLMVN
jgi:hypothetical protein